MEQLLEMYTQSLPLLPTIIRTIGTCSYYQHKNVFTIIYTLVLYNETYVGIGTDILLLQKRAPSFLASTDRIVKLFSKISKFSQFSTSKFNIYLTLSAKYWFILTPSNTHPHRTQSAPKLGGTHCRLSRTQKYFPVADINKLFDRLPGKMNSLPVRQFKCHLKRELHNWPMYSLREI